MTEEIIRFFSSFQFTSSFYFWVGGAVILFLIFFPLLKKGKILRWDRGYWVKKVPGLKRKRAWLVSGLMIVISLLIAAVFTNPQLTEKRSIPLQGKPVMVLIDVSGSIGINYSSSDPEVYSAFKEIKRVYQEIISRDLGATIGLSFYSDQSYIARDFAEKPELLWDTIENEKELQEISMGTRTAEALFAVRMFFSENIQAKDKTIILISDLEDNLDSVAYEMNRVLEDGINLNVIAIAKEFQTSQKNIQILKGKTGSSEIKMIWSGDKQGLDEICENISQMENSFISKTEIVSRKSLLPFLLPVILGLIILSIILSETIFRKIP